MCRTRVRYVPIEYLARKGKSKIRPLRDMAGFISLIARTTPYFNPLKVFLPLSAALVVASLAPLPTRRRRPRLRGRRGVSKGRLRHLTRAVRPGLC